MGAFTAEQARRATESSNGWKSMATRYHEHRHSRKVSEMCRYAQRQARRMAREGASSYVYDIFCHAGFSDAVICDFIDAMKELGYDVRIEKRGRNYIEFLIGW